MARAPYNTLVIPYIVENGLVKYCVLLREDMKVWQFIAGGGEDDEAPIDAAKREAIEEIGILGFKSFREIETKTYVPTKYFKNARELWGDRFVIPVHCFAMETYDKNIMLSDEHLSYLWLAYEEAENILHFDVDKTALYEIDCQIKYNRRAQEKYE